MISIIGAGPSGSYLAYLLAKSGMEVQIFEDHKCVGVPIQCTGILTESFLEIIEPKKEFLVNTISRISVNSPNNSRAVLEMKKKDYIVNRTLFDNYFCSLAVDNGAKLFLNHRFLDFKNGVMEIKDNYNSKIKKIKTDILVGADGPLSSVAKSAGIYGKRKILIGMQAVIKMQCEKNKFDTYFGSAFPKFFGWFVPEADDIARVGLAAEDNPKQYFDEFIKKFNGRVLEIQAGPIPVYNPEIQIQKENIYLVGDAACQIKNTTGGGIVFGLIGAKILADCIINNTQTETNDQRPMANIKDYQKEIKKKLGKDLMAHYYMRKVLDRFTDKDYNKLVELVKQEKVKNILENFDREFPSKFIAKLLLTEPRFLWFGRKLFW